MLRQNDNNELNRAAESAAAGGRLRLDEAVVELFRHREHGKTARTIAICACVLGGIAAISAAKVLKYFYWFQSAPKRRTRRQIKATRAHPTAHSRKPSVGLPHSRIS